MGGEERDDGAAEIGGRLTVPVACVPPELLA
jgi:hypothetical protein